MDSILIDEALPRPLFELLRKYPFERHAGQYPAGDLATVIGHSYWFSLRAKPRLLVEHAALALARHVPDLADVQGVEWWINALDPTAGMVWHFDADREAATPVHPRFSSILYMSDAGGPTVILDQKLERGRVSPEEPSEAMAYFPRANRFGLFDGNARHGVAALQGPSDGSLRLSVLYNWWHTKPSPPTCIEVAYDDPFFEVLQNAPGARFDGEPLAMPAEAVRLADPGAKEVLTELSDRPYWR